VADPGFANGGPRSSATGASIEAPSGIWGGGIPLPNGGGVWGKFFDFVSENGDF